MGTKLVQVAGPAHRTETKTLAAFLIRYGFKRVAALIEDSEYGRDIDRLLDSSLKPWGSFVGQAVSLVLCDCC